MCSSDLVDDAGIGGAGGQVDGAHKQGHLVILVQVLPQAGGEGIDVPFNRDGGGLPFVGGDGVAIALVGVDEMAQARLARVLEGLAQAAGTGLVGGLEDRQLIAAVGA